MYRESSRNSTSNPSSKRWSIRHYLKPGDVGYLIYLHGILYAEEYGYDRTFEAYVAGSLAGFVQSFNFDEDRIWVAEIDGRTVGSIAIVGHSRAVAQLRWFLVHPDYRELGLGRELIEEAILFCRERRYKSVFLWTTNELSVARHLYISLGFRRTEEKAHRIWGKDVAEERYDLRLRNKMDQEIL